MNLSTSSYVPSLRIRAAELQALHQLKPNLVSRIHPLFTLPPIEFDFETRQPKSDIDTYIERRIQTIEKNWIGSQCWIDIHSDIRETKLKGNKSIISHLVSSLTQPKLFGEPELFIPVLSINDAEHISEEIYISWQKVGSPIIVWGLVSA